MRDRPRVPGILATLVAAVLAVAAHGPVLAGGVTAEQLIGIGESQYAMTCTQIVPTAAALAVFAAFAAVSFGLWGYFRFRPSRGDVTG